jgi:hypothetical protein
MKKVLLSLALVFTASVSFCQTFMHGAGVAILVSSSTGNTTSVGEGFTYSPRVNFLETEDISVSVGIPLSFGISGSYSGDYNNYNGYNANNTLGFVFNAPLIVNLNIGRGSTKENSDKMGYFLGAGFGYHHASFNGDNLDENGNYISGISKINSFGPQANAGVRIGVGRSYKNIEINLSYMKGVNATMASLYGLACLYNF